MAFNLKPLGSRVVIEPIEQEDITASGIVLPETAKEKPQRGLVLSIGPGDRDGYYYLTTAGADYRLNRRTTAKIQYQNRHFRPAQATLLQGYDENIGSIALIRTF